MEVGSDRSNQDGAKPVDEAEALRLIQALAEALRAEFGVGVDAHPGGEGNEAGVVNRAFWAAVRSILPTIGTPRDYLSVVQSWALREAAAHRLVELSVNEGQIEGLLDLESGLGDRWTTYLTLAPEGDRRAAPFGQTLIRPAALTATAQNFRSNS
jgi:hypothetical protein